METNAVLLAGGQSTRMGRNKALLEHNGSTLLTIAHNKLKTILGSAGRVFVSGNYPGYFCIPDEIKENGPVEGVWSCTREMQFGIAVLVVPVDMPFIEIESLKTLIECLQIGGTYQMAQYADFEMPFIFSFDKNTNAILTKVRNELNPSHRSFKMFKNQLRGHILPCMNPDSFKNINTPSEWAEALL